MEQLIETLETIFAPWAAMAAEHPAVTTIVVTVHLLALLLGGGAAVAVDRMTLAVGIADDRGRDRQLRVIRQTHGAVLFALVASVVSGVLIVAADVRVFVGSPLLWLKLGVVALLLVNGALLRGHALRLSDGAPAILWRRLRLHAKLSLLLWSAAVVCGVLLRDYV